jgi:2,4-dienoyl-CoA reductase (NADPH2)
VDWFRASVAARGISVVLGRHVSARDLTGFDEVIVATGVTPRDPEIPGQDAHALGYIDVLKGAQVGQRVAVIGAGGIGFDVSEYLVTEESPTESLPDWLREWGVTDPEEARAGLAPEGPQPDAPARQVIMLQRKPEKPGKRLGKTTGWIHRAALKMKGVEMRSGVNYEKIDTDGLHVSYGAERERPEVIACDTVVLCAGQVSNRTLADELEAAGVTCHVIGGADVAAELDAKRAIDQGVRLAAML